MKKYLPLLFALCFLLRAGHAQTTEQRIDAIYNRIDALESKLITFWKTYGPDKTYPGFSATLDVNGNSVSPWDKSTVQETRHLWAFTTWYQLREQTPAVQAICDNLYGFITQHMYNASRKWFYLDVYSNGNFKSDNWRLYDNGFAIYALSQYAITFNKPQAAQIALDCFKAMDQVAHDATYGGYDNTKGDNPTWLPSGAEKEYNTSLHLLEAFTTLYQATGDLTVKARCNEMLDIFRDKIIQPLNYAHLNFNTDWSTFDNPVVSYGHDIESLWLVWECAKAMNRTDDTILRNKLIGIGKLSVVKGYDTQHGGYFYQGSPTGGVSDYSKQWWVQAEALTGLIRLYKFTGDTSLLTRLEGTLKWIENYQLNKKTGEWYDTMDQYGNVTSTTNMGHYWKASYHTLRATMFSKDFIRDELITSSQDKELAQANFLIFPNPASGVLHISFNNSQEQEMSLAVYNAAGQQVLAQAVKSNSLQQDIDISSLPKGIYFLARDINGKRSTEKFIVN